MSTGRCLVWLILVEFVLSSTAIHESMNGSGLSFAVSPASSQALLPSEAYSMRHLRYSLRIRNFYWPKARDPCVAWRGVLCENGHVVSIYLSGLKRTLLGMAQPTFAMDNLRGLPSLRLLNATSFVMLGSIPDWFGQLSALQVLDFSSCSLSGSIPDAIGQLRSLQRLSLAQNNLIGRIPSFSGASELVSLDLSGNLLNGPIPDTLGALSKLEQLDLRQNSLSGRVPAELGRLRKLRTLRLSDNALRGSIPEDIVGCSMLTELVLANNSLEAALPSSLGYLQELTLLNLSFNNLTGFLSTGLSNLTSLERLALSQNMFYGPLPGGVAALRKLSVLDVSNNYLNSTLPIPIFRGAVINENCFLDVPGQRLLKTCEAFYAARGLYFTGNASSLDKPTPMLTGQSRRNKHLGVILGGVFGGLGLIVLIVGLVLFILKCERRRGSPKQPEVAPPMQSSGATQPVPTVGIAVKMSSIGESFTFPQLQRATQDFDVSNFIKAGHSGDLYRGVLDGGAPVVVKRIEVPKMRKDLLTSELEVFGKASHTRLVPLLGHCLELDDLKFLVYKYMPNMDLAQALHKKVTPSPPADILQSLDWITRLKIATGAAEGLTYLHHECSPPLVHRDIQASSILLDDKYEVRLGSLSETRTQEGEAQPGLITRILRLSQTTDQGDQGSPVASCAYDVYCFGKVLLELVSGKLDISGSRDSSSDAWLEWALSLIDRHNKEAMAKLVDPSLIVDEDLLEEVWAMAIIAKLCLNPRPSKRPQIRHILRALENPQRVTREEHFSSSLRSRTSSHSSWNPSLFGSWRQSSSENVIAQGMLREEYVVDPNRKHSGTSHSQGSLPGEQSFHRRPGSSEIFPEPLEDVQVRPSSIGGSDRQQQQQQQQQQEG